MSRSAAVRVVSVALVVQAVSAALAVSAKAVRADR
jgi:hypothetical protein